MSDKYDASRASASRIIVKRLMGRLGLTEKREWLTEAFLEATKAHNDDAASTLLGLLRENYEEQERILVGAACVYDRISHQARVKYRAQLMDLYWELPEGRETNPGRVDGSNHKVQTLVKTKTAMVECVSEAWVGEPTVASMSAFRFLIAACEPQHGSMLPGESEWETKARGREMSHQEAEMVLGVIAQRASSDEAGFRPWRLAGWFCEPRVPVTIKKILARARSEAGGVELAARDIRNARLLEDFKPDKRSASAFLLLEKYGKAVRPLDEASAVLLERLKSAKIEGVNIVLLGADKTNHISVEVALPPDASHERGHEIFAAAGDRIAVWRKSDMTIHSTIQPVQVDLFVHGGATNLDLHRYFKD